MAITHTPDQPPDDGLNLNLPPSTEGPNRVFAPTRLTLARQMEGRSFWWVAQQVGGQVADIIAFEDGSASPGPETVEVIAKALGWPVEHFYAPDIELIDWRETSLRWHLPDTTSRPSKAKRRKPDSSKEP